MIYRRAISLIDDGRTVEAEVEDDFHHFGICFAHRDGRIEDVAARSLRFPWNACGAESAAHFGSIRGLRVASPRAQLATADRHTQCTHMFDLLECGIALLLRGEQRRLYEIAVQVRPGRGATRAVIRCNSERRFALSLDKGKIVAPRALRGLALAELAAAARTRGVRAAGDLDEVVKVLQRAVHVAFGKGYGWQRHATPAEMGLPPTCYTLQPERVTRVVRERESERDFTAIPGTLLGGRVDELRRLATPPRVVELSGVLV